LHKGPLSDIPVNPLVRSYERHCRAANHSPATIAHRGIVLRRFIAFCQEEGFPEDLRDVRGTHVEAWMEALQFELRPHSVRSYTAALRAFYQWLVDEEEVEKHPMARIAQPFAEPAEKDLASQKDLLRVFAMLDKAKRWRDASLIAIIYGTGVRASELANVRMEDVDLDAGLMRVLGKGRKYRTVPLSPRVVRYIDRYLRSRRQPAEYLLTGRQGKLTKTGVYRAVRRCFAEAGVKAVIGAHDLRHTWASSVVDEVSESDMMAGGGWTDASMVRHYTSQVRARKSIEALRKASPLERLYRQ